MTNSLVFILTNQNQRNEILQNVNAIVLKLGEKELGSTQH